MPTRMAPAIAAIRRNLAENEIVHLRELPWPPRMRVLELAPHPDDFDAIAVTLRFFRDRGDEIHLVVLSPSASGVEDSFCAPPTLAVKAALREREQRESCRMFGLPDDRIVFLRLVEDEAGDPRAEEDNYSIACAHLLRIRPDLVLLPHGNDPNPGHRLGFDVLLRFAARSGLPPAALLNRDPKTRHMSPDIYTFFEEEDARWKAELLRCHRSQQQRNLNSRGCGFDERILQVNRRAAGEVTGRAPYAEVFELWPGSH